MDELLQPRPRSRALPSGVAVLLLTVAGAVPAATAAPVSAPLPDALMRAVDPMAVTAPSRLDAIGPAPLAGFETGPQLAALPGLRLGEPTAFDPVAGDPVDGLLHQVARKQQKGSSSYGGASGLPWKSGAACSGTEFTSWRGRKMDVGIGWAPQESWSSLVRYFQRSGAKRVAAGGQASIGLPLLAKGSDGKFKECAAGAFDSHFKAIGSYLNSQGNGNTIVRLGWEANNHSYPWRVQGDVAGFKACFARAATALRSGAPGIQIAWHMAKKGKHKGPVTELYPGDAYVNQVSLSYYDRFPFHHNATVWAQQYNATYNGGPYGLGAWLNFARSRGKKLSIGEWGVNDGYDGGGTDNAFYVQKMGEFFRGNAGSIGYEGYYNCNYTNPGIYRIHPTNHNPRAAAAYLANWRG